MAGADVLVPLRQRHVSVVNFPATRCNIIIIGLDRQIVGIPGMEDRVAIIREDHHSEHTRFEAPAPVFWCSKGYVLVYHDHRGVSQSPGFLKPFSNQHYDGRPLAYLPIFAQV